MHLARRGPLRAFRLKQLSNQLRSLFPALPRKEVNSPVKVQIDASRRTGRSTCWPAQTGDAQTRPMPAYKPMPLHLETGRLRLRPWTESDADELRVLHSERGNGTPTVERAREIIAKQLAATAATGIALLPIRR